MTATARGHRRWLKGDVVDDRATHPHWFAALEERLGRFTLDVAASHQNTKCARYYTAENDGLAMPWDGEQVWCNPPYSDIGPWVKKAWAEYPATALIAMLLPASRTEQPWWQHLVEPFRDNPASPLVTTFLPGRMAFLRPGQTAVHRGERPPFGCVLLVWDPRRPSDLVYDPNVVTGGLFG